MATLRPCEERDAKDRTIRFNPTVTFKQDRQIREVIGRHDWRLIENRSYHDPITAQAQDGRILFFAGVADNSQTRKAAKEMTVADVEAVAPYIIKELRARPMKVREARPTVYEVKLAMIGDVETTAVEEMTPTSDGSAVTFDPIAPDLSEAAARRQRRANPEAESSAE